MEKEQKKPEASPSQNATAARTKQQEQSTARTSPPPRPSQTSPTASSGGKRTTGGKNGNRVRIGGTAVPGARSMQPKQISETNNPQQQQHESYNRDMRRRMERMGIGPQDNEDQMKEMQKRRDKRKKNIERKKQRLEEQRIAIRKSSPIGKISLGRKNLYFIIAVAVLLILLIVFAVLRSIHVI